MAVFSRSFDIDETMITDGTSACNVKVKLEEYMMFDEHFEEHFKCTGKHTAVSKEPIIAHRVIDGTTIHEEATFNHVIHKYSGTWTVKSIPTGQIHIGALDKNGVVKSFTANIQEILRYVRGRRLGYERLCVFDRETCLIKVISSGSYKGITHKMINHQ